MSFDAESTPVPETTESPDKATREKKVKFHAVLRNGTVIQHWQQKQFEANVSKHPPEDIVFAVKGDELRPHKVTSVTFAPA